MKNNVFQRLIVPGLIFQSTMIGGGYATGRELVEFFLKLGPIAALVAMLIATIVISLVCAVAFEFSRVFRLYDYRVFFQKLLGSGWVLFEIIYVLMMLLVLSVLGAASGELVSSRFDVPPLLGSVTMMAAVGILVFWGAEAISRFLSAWSILLYMTYTALIVFSVVSFGDTIADNLFSNNQPTVNLSAVYEGLAFSGYNVVVFTAVLFVVCHFKNRRDAVWAGLLCGPLGIMPGLLLLIAMIAHYPIITDEKLPISYILNQLQSPGFLLLIQVVMFGTFIETGTALLHSINERINAAYNQRSKNMPRLMRPLVAITLLLTATYLADAVGIVSLISKGYVYSTYIFLALVVLPLLTRGILLIIRHGKDPVPDINHQPSICNG